MLGKQKRCLSFFFYSIVFFLPLAIYILTLAPTVTFGDSGELIAAAFSLGIPHPPGFPIWVILAFPFTLLPIKNIAWRVNLSSAVFSALATLVLAKIIIEVLTYEFPRMKKSSQYFIAASLCLTFAFSKSVWVNSVISEVYSLQALLGLLIILIFSYWYHSGKKSFLYLLSFLLGLSLTNHYLSFTFLPPVILGVFLKERNIIKQVKTLTICSVLFLVGLSFFLYLPIRSSHNPLLDWGGPKNLTRFINHIIRKQYGSDDPRVANVIYLPIRQDTSYVQRIVHGVFLFGRNNWITFGPLLMIGILGLYLSLKKRSQLSFYLFLILLALFGGPAIYILIANPKAIATGESFAEMLLPLSIVPVFTAIGLAAILVKFKKFSNPVLLTILIFPFSFLFLNYRFSDYSKNNFAYLHAQNILNTLPEKATLIAQGDESTFPLFYLLKVEKIRPDIRFLDKNGNLYPFSYPLELWEEKTWKNLDEFLGFLDELDRQYNRESNETAFLTDIITCNEKPHLGILTLPEKRNEQEVDFLKLYGNVLTLNNSEIVKDLETRRVVAYYHLAYGFSSFKKGDLKTAKTHFQLAKQIQFNDSWTIDQISRCYSAIGEKEEAADVMEEKMTVAPEKVSSYLNLGVMYAKKGDFEKAEEEYKEAMEMDPKVIPVAAKNLGYLYMEQGKIEEAQEMFKLVLKTEPEIKDDKFFYAFGSSFLQQDKYELAETYLKMAVEINNDFPESHINLSLCLIKLEKFDEAKEHLERTLELDPENKRTEIILNTLTK